jgi:two-component system, OmpR family, response regulator QseB
MRILVVEDDELIATGIVAGLRAHGMAVDRAATAAAARGALAATAFDLVILDLGLPDSDGMDLLRRWRDGASKVPVLVLTARDALEARLAGLRGGADDYVLKPFDLDELVARVHALLRRAAGRAADHVDHGSLRVDAARREVTLDGRPVELARREFDVLLALVNARGRILSAAQLQDSLYGFDEAVDSNAINVHIHHLRRKLGADAIETVRGLGYRLGPVRP